MSAFLIYLCEYKNAILLEFFIHTFCDQKYMLASHFFSHFNHFYKHCNSCLR